MRHRDYSIVVIRSDTACAEAGAVVSQISSMVICVIWKGQVLRSAFLVSLAIRANSPNLTYLDFLVSPTARPIINASKQRNALSSAIRSVRRLRPRYRLCGGRIRSRRFDDVQPRPAPAPVPRAKRLFLPCPSSGASHIVAVLHAPISFECVCDGSSTSWLCNGFLAISFLGMFWTLMVSYGLYYAI